MKIEGQIPAWSLIAVQFLLVGCQPLVTETDRTTKNKPSNLNAVQHPFKIHWPPKDPHSRLYQSAKPLLTGELLVTANGSLASIQISLRRPHNSAQDSDSWNSALKFPEYAWMSRVRVWDHEKKWLWPNLPYLLRNRGIDRVERYGGVDPGKGVDNDFAAIAIRPLGGEQPKNAETSFQITAEWTGLDGAQAGRQAVVHDALSKPLKVELQGESGELGVWLLYADLLDYDLPKTWPPTSEGDGGILAWFRVKWQASENGSRKISIAHERPKLATGIDWIEWQLSQP